MKKTYDRIIVGAGASGLFAASLSEHVRGMILDHSSHPGHKLLISGSGQCNITHGGNIKDFITHYGNHGKRMRNVLYQASNEMLIRHIETLGVPLVERPDGKVFPRSKKASDVLTALLRQAEINGYGFSMDTAINRITHDDSRYIIETDTDIYETPVLIIATGGRSYPRTGSDGSMYTHLSQLGIPMEETAPALVPIFVHSYGYRDISGVSFENISVTLRQDETVISSRTGDVLLTHKGFSGPAVLDSSRYAMPGMTLEINYVYPRTREETLALIKNTYQKNRKQIVPYLSHLFSLPQSFCEAYLKTMHIDPSMKANALTGEIMETAADLACSRMTISGLGSFREAMVTKGGVSLDAVNLKTMESINHKGLYFIGEVLDIDGDTGGYNLQFAFSSAACSIRSIQEAGM